MFVYSGLDWRQFYSKLPNKKITKTNFAYITVKPLSAFIRSVKVMVYMSNYVIKNHLIQLFLENYALHIYYNNKIDFLVYLSFNDLI